MYPNSVRPYLAFIQSAAKKYNVPEGVIVGTILTESNGNQNATNPNPLRPSDPSAENSRGLMQISQRTALNELGFGIMTIDSLFDPRTNINAGARLLSMYYKQLSPFFDDYMTVFDRWKVVTNSYNQGTNRWAIALQNVKLKNVPQTFDLVRQELYSLSNLPSITRQHASFYGEKVMAYAFDVKREAPIKNSIVFDSNISQIALYTTGAIAVLGIGYFMITGLEGNYERSRQA